MVFTASLDDGPEDIGWLAGRSDEIESSMMESIEVLVPIGQARGHDYPGVLARCARGGDHVSIVAIGEPAVAKD